MPKTFSDSTKNLARAAAVEASQRAAVGDFIETIDEGDNVVTFLFENKQKGYVGWRWSVTLHVGEPNDEATVSEVLLMPGPDSLIAPNWVPWSERLADYKALQAELEAQAALDAEDDEDETDIEAEAVEEIVEELEAAVEVLDDEAENSVDENSVDENSAPANSEESQDAEGDAEKASKKKPRFLRRRKRFGKDKTKNQGD